MNSINGLSTFSEFDIFNRIKFYNKNHIYKIDGTPTSISVTRFLNLFTPVFDRDAKALAVAKRNNVDIQTVIAEWEYEKEIACLRGTILHNYIDNYLHNKIIPISTEEIAKLCNNNEKEIESFMLKIAKLVIQFESFYSYYSDRFTPLKSEFVVGDIEDTQICGTIDNLSLCKREDVVYIIDYKTNKKFTEKNNFNSFLTGPVSYLEDTKLNVYGLQLGMYKYILEKYTSLKVKCLIVWFNENNSSYKLYTPPIFNDEIKLMISHYKNPLAKALETKVSGIEEYIESIAD